MKMIVPPRRLNPSERYPCSVIQPRSRSRDTDIGVGIGLTRDYSFDSQCGKRPAVQGRVIASISLNGREGADGIGQLRLYPVYRSVYSGREADRFASEVPDQTARWYETRPEENRKGMINCVRCMRADHDRGGFRIRCFRFQ